MNETCARCGYVFDGADHACKKKHNILTGSDLWARCSVCHKKQSLMNEILASHTDGYVPFNQEECDPDMQYVYPDNTHLTLKFPSKSLNGPSELEQAFKELMEAFPDGSAH